MTNSVNKRTPKLTTIMTKAIDNNNLHTVYIDGVPCHWQVMRSFRPEGSKLVCVRSVNRDVDMSEEERKKYAKTVEVENDFVIPNDDPIVNGFKERFGINESDMRSILTIAKSCEEKKIAYRLLKELEEKDGFVCN